MFPIALDVRNRRVLVVGGGKVAARKVAALIEAGASVTAISPSFAPHFPARHLINRPFQRGDCAHFSLVFAATDSPEVNRFVGEEAHRRGAWFNDASDPESSDFHTSSIVRRDEICIGITTGRTSPVLAKHLRARIEDAIGEEYTRLLQIVAEFEIPLEKRGVFWRELLQSDALELLRRGNDAAARAEVERVKNLSQPLSLPRRGE